jgi:hypothetical protein
MGFPLLPTDINCSSDGYRAAFRLFASRWKHVRPMMRFQVHLLARSLQVIVGSAEDAYRWLDEHAQPGERYALSALPPTGGAVALESDIYVKPTAKRAG